MIDGTLITLDPFIEFTKKQKRLAEEKYMHIISASEIIDELGEYKKYTRKLTASEERIRGALTFTLFVYMCNWVSLPDFSIYDAQKYPERMKEREELCREMPQVAHLQNIKKTIPSKYMRSLTRAIIVTGFGHAHSGVLQRFLREARIDGFYHEACALEQIITEQQSKVAA